MAVARVAAALHGEERLMVTTPATSTELLHNRNRMVAKSFYRQLRTEGFSHEQIIELSATLLDLVNNELKDEPAELSARA